jgi:hypothetical protein
MDSDKQYHLFLWNELLLLSLSLKVPEVAQISLNIIE